MPVSMLSAKELTMDLLIRYGFQLLGALVVLVAGALLARWVGNATGKWLETRTMEPPVRTLIVRVVRAVVLIFTLVVALDKFGFQIAPLVAGIGVAGLGIGIALQGVLSNVVAGLSIIFTKPFRVGEYIALLGVQGEVSVIELFSTTLVHPDRSRVVIPNRKIVGEILHNYGAVRQLALSVQVGYGSDLGQVLTTARELAATLIANSPGALQATKRLLVHCSQAELIRRLELGVEESVAIRNTADFREGLAAFLEKRKPKWSS